MEVFASVLLRKNVHDMKQPENMYAEGSLGDTIDTIGEKASSSKIIHPSKESNGDVLPSQIDDKGNINVLKRMKS